MLNTCSIGRRWKSREGWSRPVLTGERGTLFPIPLLGWGLGLVLWWFSRWMARNAVSCGHDDDTGKAFDLLASVVRFPDRHDRNRGWFRCRPIPVGGWPSCIGFAVVMAQVRRPVPFRTRKLRPGTAMVLHSRGCGRVARRRILSLGVPVELRLREPPFSVFLPVSASRGVQKAPIPQHPRITWSVSVTVINDVMRLTRYVRAGSRESRYDGKRHKPDD